MWDALEAMIEVEQRTSLSATLLARRRTGFIECALSPCSQVCSHVCMCMLMSRLKCVWSVCTKIILKTMLNIDSGT